jgi:hypothetical protein
VSTEPGEPITNSFVVKLRLETIGRTGIASWRGLVTHVPSGDRRAFEDLDDLVAFISGYLRWPPMERRRSRVRRLADLVRDRRFRSRRRRPH